MEHRDHGHPHVPEELEEVRASRSAKQPIFVLKQNQVDVPETRRLIAVIRLDMSTDGASPSIAVVVHGQYAHVDAQGAEFCDEAAIEVSDPTAARQDRTHAEDAHLTRYLDLVRNIYGVPVSHQSVGARQSPPSLPRLKGEQ